MIGCRIGEYGHWEVSDEGECGDRGGRGNGRDSVGGAARAAGSDKRRRRSVSCVGFVPTELTWPSTWTDRLDRDRSLFPGTSWPEWSPPAAMARRGTLWDSECSASPTGLATAPCATTPPWSRANLAPLPGDVDFTVGASLPDLGPRRVAGTVPARPPSGGAEHPRAPRGRRSRVDGDAACTRGPSLRHRHRTRCRPSEGTRLWRAGVRRPRERHLGGCRRSRSGVRRHRRRHREAIRGLGSSRRTLVPVSGRPRRGRSTG